MGVTGESFRNTFNFMNKDVIRWFPGHMGKGLKQMQQKLRSVDCIIEVHDARIPISGRNTDFKYTISGVKPHILVLNKVDLINKSMIPKIEKSLKNECGDIVFTNCSSQNCSGIKKLFPLAQKLINQSNRYNRSNEEDFNIMIIGVPNVGKSSLTNALRVKHLGRGSATSVGATPGVTRSVLHRIKMCESPLFYMLDTPGILTPNIASMEVGLKLALCATITDHLVGETIMADYLLYWLNKHEHFDYVNYYNLVQPVDNILELLVHISKINNKTLKIKNSLNVYVIKPDLEAAAKLMLKAFRNGDLGKVILDVDSLGMNIS